MKKGNKMMRIASILFIAVLLSTCAISGTFAKYASEYTGTVGATVAHWEFQLNDATIVNDFAIDLTATVTETDGSAEDEVSTGFIAPGTKGTFNIKLTNDSDVTAAYNVVITPTGTWPFTPSSTGATTGELDPGASVTIVYNWVWPFDGDHNSFAGNDLTGTATITLTQVD